jgi:hypothetical protein
MSYLKTYYCFLVMAVMSINAAGQDRIYNKENKVNDYEVKEITPAYIKYVDVKTPKDYTSISLSNVLFIFNSIGNFLVVPHLFDNESRADRFISNFLSKETNALSGSDKIITVKNDLVICTVAIEGEKNILYLQNDQQLAIPRTDVAMIIYKNGRHKLLVNVNKCFKVLSAIQEKYYETVFPKAASPGSNMPLFAGNVAFVSSVSHQSNNNLHRVTYKDSTLGTAPVHQNDSKRMGKSTLLLDSATMISLQGKALMNIKELETYLKIISDKDLDAGQVNNAIEQALSLFTTEDVQVEVSSKNRTKVQLFPVKVYLNRLGFMKYSKVQIEWYNVQYVSKIRLNPDNSYTGIIEVQQRFTGILGDRKVYEDITRKTVEIVLKSYNVRKDGENVKEWEVFLGNIGIAINDTQ